MFSYARLPSPLGELLAVGDGDQLAGLYFPGHRRGPDVAPSWQHDPPAFAGLRGQLQRYFRGELTGFDVVLRPVGTAFRQDVWQALCAVPYGTTLTYAELAAALGRPGAARAVAGAVARNPISILIPCHRIVGSGHRLVGYAGGVERKRRLLDLERGAIRLPQPPPRPT